MDCQKIEKHIHTKNWPNYSSSGRGSIVGAVGAVVVVVIVVVVVVW